jgi:speckle-type POZ protein
LRPCNTTGDGMPSGSASAIVASGAIGYHVLKIDGYSRTKHAVPNGEYVDSRPFTVAGLTWAIRYYPNGRHQDSADCISFYLVLMSQVAENVTVQFLLSFINEVEKHAPSTVRAQNANVFSNESPVWGRTKFIKRKDLEESTHLKDDCFKIRCDMIITGELSAEDVAASSIIVPRPDWPQHFQTLLLSRQGADVSIVVGDEAFAAHRCVLAARSPVFNAALFGAMKEGTTIGDIIRIDDILPQVFKCLLHFIYTDSLPEIEGEDASSPAMAQHLLEAADRYGMQRLKLVCEDRLPVATTLALAEQHHCRGLKEACFNFFLKSSETLNAVKETDGFQHLVKSCPSVIFELMSKLAARSYMGEKGKDRKSFFSRLEMTIGSKVSSQFVGFL